MRSYYAHLATTQPISGPIVPKPVFRSSAIFPVVQRREMTTRILFLGYWILKRNIHQITAVISLRDTTGHLLVRQHMPIDKALAYRIELQELLELCKWESNRPFDGSVEIEFYSGIGLVFPYPAVVVNYYGQNFSSVVHTAQRVFNDFDDMQKNSETTVPESGFNVFADSDREPLIGLINGPIQVKEGVLSLDFYNAAGEILAHKIPLGSLLPYQTSMIFPTREVDLEKFLQGSVGFCRAQFNVRGIFPRLLIGSWLRNETGIAVTHTYYDCSLADSESDYWTPSNPDWYPASLMVPVDCIDERYTNITFYPIYSPSDVEIAVEIYDSSGKLLGDLKSVLTVTSPGRQLKHLPLHMLLAEMNIPSQQPLAARIIATPYGESRMPARIKLGLDLGQKNNPLPCNICTNLQPYNPKAEGKERSFKWAPLLVDKPGARLWLMNSSPRKTGIAEAKVEMSFYREKDEEKIVRNIVLPPQGFLYLDADKDQELKNFFEGSPGWCSIITNNSYLTTYYFSENPDGAVGGDHGF